MSEAPTTATEEQEREIEARDADQWREQWRKARQSAPNGSSEGK